MPLRTSALSDCKPDLMSALPSSPSDCNSGMARPVHTELPGHWVWSVQAPYLSPSKSGQDSRICFVVTIYLLFLQLCCGSRRWPSGKPSTWREGDAGIELRIPWWSDSNDLKTGMLVATLPGAWRCRVGAKPSWPRVSVP